jgi:hypothetical protein
MSSDSQHLRPSVSKWTRTVLKWLAVSLLLSSVTSCAALGFGHSRPKQPPRELCILGDAGCLCFDPRLPVDQQSYVRPYPQCLNYIATNPVDYDAGQEWITRNCYGPRPAE